MQRHVCGRACRLSSVPVGDVHGAVGMPQELVVRAQRPCPWQGDPVGRPASERHRHCGLCWWVSDGSKLQQHPLVRQLQIGPAGQRRAVSGQDKHLVLPTTDNVQRGKLPASVWNSVHSLSCRDIFRQSMGLLPHGMHELLGWHSGGEERIHGVHGLSHGMVLCGGGERAVLPVQPWVVPRLCPVHGVPDVRSRDILQCYCVHLLQRVRCWLDADCLRRDQL